MEPKCQAIRPTSTIVRRFICTVFATVLTVTATGWLAGKAQPSKPTQPTQTTKTVPRLKTFLWEVESPTNTVYLLGSIHFLKPDDYPLPSPLQAAFDDAEGVVFELDLRAAGDPALQRILLQRAQPDQPGESLEMLLNAQAYSLAEQAAREVGLPIEAFGRFEPWFFTLSILPLYLQQLGFDARYGVDQYFFTQAVEAGKDIIALETFEYQVSLFDDFSVAEQQEFLLQTLEELDTLETSLNELVDAWSVGDAATLENLLLSSFADYPQLKEKILITRNRNWIGPIVNLLQDDQDYLVIVGAGHLVGAEGVVELLEAQGYVVEQVAQ